MLLSLLSNRIRTRSRFHYPDDNPHVPSIDRRYVLDVVGAISQFLEYPLQKKLTIGYSSTKLVESTPFMKSLEQYLPSSDTSYSAGLTKEECEMITNLYEKEVSILRENYPDNSPKTKGYAFRTEYTFTAKESAVMETKVILESIQYLLSSGKLKEYTDMKQKQEEDAAQEEEERKKMYEEERRTKYLAILTKAEGIEVPRHKKKAILVDLQDLDALVYAIHPYSFDEYSRAEGKANSIRNYFDTLYDKTLKVWMPNEILHCANNTTGQEAIFRF